MMTMELLPILNTIFYFLGLLASGAGFVLPWFTTMVAIKSDQHVGQRSPVAFIATFFNCLLWAIYGCWPKENDWLILLNVLGALSQLVYIIKFLSYCDYEDGMWWLVYLATGFFPMVGVIFFYLSDMESNILFYCWACGLSRGLLAVAPLLNMRLVCQQRSMESMPSFWLCLVSLLNAICWGAFACTGDHFDRVIFYPSLAGAASAALLMTLHIALRPTPTAELAQPLVQ